MSREYPAMHAAINTPCGLAVLRDLKPDDIEETVSFWHGSSDEFLDFLGVDRSRLGSTEDTRQRFIEAIPTGDPNQPRRAFAITVNGDIAQPLRAGYKLLSLAHHQSCAAREAGRRTAKRPAQN